ncbi:MAG: hypothetical protein MHPSP_004090, partial [Paramarteilia canceri]
MIYFTILLFTANKSYDHALKLLKASNVNISSRLLSLRAKIEYKLCKFNESSHTQNQMLNKINKEYAQSNLHCKFGSTISLSGPVSTLRIKKSSMDKIKYADLKPN